MKEKWIPLVARRWFALNWSALAHIQQEGLKFPHLYWSNDMYMSVRYGGPYIHDFEYNGEFQKTNFSSLIQKRNKSLEHDFDEMDHVIEDSFSFTHGKTKKDALRLYKKYKQNAGLMVMAFWLGPACQHKIKSLIGDKTFEKFQIEFSVPYKPTLWIQEQNEIKKVYGELESGKIRGKMLQREIGRIVLRYGFLHSDGRATEWKAGDYLENLKSKTISSSHDGFEFNTNDPYINWLLHISRRLSYIFDEGKCALIRLNWALRKTVLNLGLKEINVMALSEEEFIKWIQENVFPSENLEEREKYHGIYVQGKIYNEFFGKEKIETLIQKEHITVFQNIHEEIKELKGQVAYKGYAKGMVRRTFCENDAKNLIEGEILVSSMTQPELLHGMRKAAAFITDEGGLLCHAAIIAREMNKPCIIGTKIATKVLKDGDFVEVDAERGVVRILKKLIINHKDNETEV